MDASQRQGHPGVHGRADCGSYIRPVRAGVTPAGPDGISRPAPHAGQGLCCPVVHSGLTDRGLTCSPSHPRRNRAHFSGHLLVIRGSCSLLCPHSGGLPGNVQFVRPIMGQQGPDRARCFVRERHGDDIGRTSTEPGGSVDSRAQAGFPGCTPGMIRVTRWPLCYAVGDRSRGV